MWLRSHTNTQY